MSLTLRQFLNIYIVNVRKKFARDALDFSEFNSSSLEIKDFLEIFNDFFNQISTNLHNNVDSDTITGVTNLKFEPRNRTISGMISCGSYGVEGKLYNKKTARGKKISKDEAPLYNYYFKICIPSNGTSGILLLHSRGNHGCKTHFEKAFSEYLSNEKYELTTRFAPALLEFQKDYNSFHKKFKIKRLKVTEYVKQRNEDSSISGRDIKANVIVKHEVKVGRNMDSLFDFDDFAKDGQQLKISKKKFKQYVSIDIPDKADFMITVEMDGQEKTMSLHQQMEFQMSFDITNEFEDYMRKDPSFSKLEEVSQQYFKHAYKRIIGILG